MHAIFVTYCSIYISDRDALIDGRIFFKKESDQGFRQEMFLVINTLMY